MKRRPGSNLTGPPRGGRHPLGEVPQHGGRTRVTSVTPRNERVKCKSKLFRRLRGAGIIALALLLLGSPFLARWRSLVVMGLYDWSYQRHSLPHTTGVELKLPLRGSGLYPGVITFNDDPGMSHWLGTPVRFTVDFTFADFPPLRGHSAIFDPDDPLYGAYLGAYYLQGLGRAITVDEMARVAEFDQRMLALPALGLGFDQNHFEILATSEPFRLKDRNSWGADALIGTNCPDHSPAGFLPSYLQFGTPPRTSAHYPACEMVGHFEATYLAEQDLNIGLYVMAASQAQLQRLTTDVLHRSVLRSR